MSDQDRSDTESPMGPVTGGEPLHGYVNLPQNQRQAEQNEDEEANIPPLLAKKERSRYVIFF